MRFGKEMEGRSARLWFSDGHVVVGKIIDVAAHEDGDGFVFDSTSTSGTKTEARINTATWETFDHLLKYEIMES